MGFFTAIIQESRWPSPAATAPSRRMTPSVGRLPAAASRPPDLASRDASIPPADAPPEHSGTAHGMPHTVDIKNLPVRPHRRPEAGRPPEASARRGASRRPRADRLHAVRPGGDGKSFSMPSTEPAPGLSTTPAERVPPIAGTHVSGGNPAPGDIARNPSTAASARPAHSSRPRPAEKEARDRAAAALAKSPPRPQFSPLAPAAETVGRVDLNPVHEPDTGRKTPGTGKQGDPRPGSSTPIQATSSPEAAFPTPVASGRDSGAESPASGRFEPDPTRPHRDSDDIRTAQAFDKPQRPALSIRHEPVAGKDADGAPPARPDPPAPASAVPLPEPANAGPRVRIGVLEVVVSAPERPKRNNPTIGGGRSDLASRHYLRNL